MKKAPSGATQTAVRSVDKKKKQEGPAEKETRAEAPAEEAEKTASPEPAPQPDELAEARAQAEDFKRKWYSVTAEYENYRKRTARESARRYEEGRADVVCKLFPIADNLERALEACSDEATKKGISMVTASFENLLKEEQIEVIDPLGKEFDADECEAIMAVEPDGQEQSGTVKQVYRKGYKQSGKVLRYAQVVVVK